MPHPCPRPPASLLDHYAASGAYTDCYCADVPGDMSLAQYVETFYTGPVFRLERLLLRWFASRPSTDADARQVARGERDDFAAWQVEGRAADQLLMCDFKGRTRSWFRVAASGASAASGTRLYFGSAVVPVPDPRTGAASMGWTFKVLLGFHRLYSRVLLGAAASRLARGRRGDIAAAIVVALLAVTVLGATASLVAFASAGSGPWVIFATLAFLAALAASFVAMLVSLRRHTDPLLRVAAGAVFGLLLAVTTAVATWVLVAKPPFG